MTNKQYLIGEAENLFVYKLKAVETIANELNLSRKTVMNWKEKGDWDNKRKLYIKSKIAFHEELFEFARKIMKDITEDMEKGNKIDAGRMYAFCKLVPMFTKVKQSRRIMESSTTLYYLGISSKDSFNPQRSKLSLLQILGSGSKRQTQMESSQNSDTTCR